MVAGTLATRPDLVREAGVKPPALIIVGEVVALRERLRPAAGLAEIPVATPRESPA